MPKSYIFARKTHIATTLMNAYILAGGKSSRMGRDKGLLPIAGEPMVARIMRQIKPLVAQVVIVTNNADYEQFGCAVIRDEVQAAGPMGGIYTALQHSNTEQNFIISCDMPLITTNAVRYFMTQISIDTDVSVAVENGKMHPLFGIYARSCASLFLQRIQNGQLKLRDAIAQLRQEPIDMSLWAVFANINTPQEWEQLTIEN